MKGKKIIYFADDDRGIRGLVRDLFEGYSVRCFENGTDLDKALSDSEEDVYAVITDDKMPGISGRDIIDRYAPNKDFPFFLLSGRVDYKGELSDFSRSRGARFVQKPTEVAGMPKMLEDVLKRYDSKNKY